MFGPFRATHTNLGGLLWKIPWKLSRPQKARHRKRLQHVDQVVNVLDTALQQSRRAQLSQLSPSLPTSAPPIEPSTPPIPPQLQSLDPASISLTAEGQRLLAQERDKAILARRQGQGPKQGEILPDPDEEVDMGTISGDRKRLRLVADRARELGTFNLLERWKADIPSEKEMLPRDKYTMFDRKVRGYRKGVHKLPKWTRVSQRLNPPGF